jgi:hypothetical protein
VIHLKNYSNSDKGTYKKIVHALEGLTDMTKKIQQKQELKSWSDMTVPITLKDALTRLSKDELSGIRKRLDIKKASHLNKGELIELLNKKTPLLLEKLFLTMDPERYNMIKIIIRNGGYIEEPKLAARQVAWLRDSGILFTGTFQGKRIVALPEEIVKNLSIQEIDKQFMAIFLRNNDWIKLTQGFLYFYGTLTTEEIEGLLNKYLNEPFNLSDYLSVLEQACTYYQQIRMNYSGFYSISLVDPRKVKSEQQMRKDLEFFPFSKDQLLIAGEPDYIEVNDFYSQFVHFLTQNYKISSQEADGIVEKCVHDTKIGEAPGQILQFLQSRLEFKNIDAINACMEHVINLMNHSRQWFLKGYTSNELFAHEQKLLLPLPNNKENVVDFTTRKKIGRNALCPCGSNKKYKHCCGR